MEYDDDDEMEYDDNAAMALQMSVNGGGPVSLSFAAGFNTFSGSESSQAFLPSFGVQPDDIASILRTAGQSIGSMPLFEGMDACPTSQDEEGYQERIQWMDGLNVPSAATPSVVSDGEACNQVSYEVVSPILSIPPSVNSSASSIFEPPFASVAAEKRAGTARGNPEEWQLARNVKRRRIAGRNQLD
jgi:hypothetical protein